MTRGALALGAGLAVALASSACSRSDSPGASPTSSTAPTSSAAPTTTGPQAPDASSILSQAKTHALAATSAAFVGELGQGSKRLRIAFKGTADGKASDVDLDLGKRGKVHVIVVGKDVYIQGDEPFWKAQGAPATVQQAGDKFVKMSSADNTVTKDLTLKSFMGEAFGALTAGGLNGQVGSDTIDGVDCWVLTDKSGRQNGAIYVAKDSLQLIRFTGSKESPGQLTFSQWNEDLAITAPPADQVMTLNAPTADPAPTRSTGDSTDQPTR